MLIVSAETRWFHHGDIPEDVLRWFCHGDDWTQEPTRVDRYLNLGGCTTVGVKLREGRFEIKARRTAPRSLSLPGTITGLTDGWIKWSSASPDLSAVTDDVSACEPREWLPVQKERWLRWLDTGHRPTTPVAAQPFPGCTAELTRVTIGGALWWTVAIEAMGDEGQVVEMLTSAATIWLNGHQPPQPFEEFHAASYPVWLARHRNPAGGTT